ncbi:alanine racemase [Hyphococcus flavus]|uniref:Alanine racemase n=1 Tax=Hyphococcus flavus TaxID=1866326 RepID=A0AAF0CGJ0_9PROT|nr:alanine racemase [Hyphococcus flavus]WDI30732.1 alanine racemase [Hyphococcus flavus]
MNTPPITFDGGPWADINLSALCANFAMIRDQAPGAETAAVVKCDAYGLGSAPITKALLEREKCQTFFVVYPEEGATLRTLLKTSSPRIFVFDGPSEKTLPLFDQFNLIPVINSIAEANLWRTRMGVKPAGVHIDTGMNRRGAPVSDVAEIAKLDLNIIMAMSHLACASEPEHPKNRMQLDAFKDVAASFPDAQLSLAASGGALMGRDYHFDLIRAGIALYGGTPFETDDERITPVVALRAPVVQLRELAPGETIGYGATFIAKRPFQIATVALGYGDGYPRAGSNRASAIINGERAPLAGRVSMDFITLDVTDLKNPPKIHDIAEFFGPALPVHETAQNCDRVPYDMFTGLGGRVDRRYV